MSTQRAEIFGLPRRYWLLWVAVLILWTGRFVTPFLASYLTTDLGIDAGTTGLVISAYGFGGILASLFGGALSDRWGRLPVVLVSQLGSAVMLVVLASIGDPVMMAIALFAYGAIGQMGAPALSAFIADLVPIAKRERAYSLQVWAMNFGFAVGPIIATSLAKISFSLIFYVEAGTLVLISVILAVVLRGGTHGAGNGSLVTDKLASGGLEPAGPEGKVDTPERSATGLRDGYRAVFGDRVFLIFVLLMIGYTLVYFQNTSGLPIAMGELGLTTDDYARLLTINGALLCLFQLPMIKVIERFDKNLVLVVAFLVTAVGFGLQIIATSWTMLAVATAVWTVGELGTFPVAATTVANLAPEAFRGTYQGIYNLTWSFSHGLAPIVGGAIIHWAGGPVLWTICAGFLVLVAVGALITRRPRVAREQAALEADQLESRNLALAG